MNTQPQFDPAQIEKAKRLLDLVAKILDQRRRLASKAAGTIR